MQCVQIKRISRLFAKNLNDINIHLFGQNVYYSVSILLLPITLYTSPSSNVPFGLFSTLLSLHFWHFIVAPEKLKLDFNISTAKWILEKQLQTTESRTNSWEFWYLCKRVSNFYIKWIQIYRETEIQEGYLSISHHTINTFQKQISCLNSRTFSKNFWFAM